MEMYLYCGVSVKDAKSTYSYISDIGELDCGTYVVVPFGDQNFTRIGMVESCCEYTEETAPYPVEMTKHIIRIATKEEYDAQKPLPLHPSYEDECIEEVKCYIEQRNWEEVFYWALDNHDSEDERIIQEVIECYRLCMEQNMPAAALNLGTFYYNGRGVEQDFSKAFELYKIAADGGELRAICNIGYCYYYGRDREVDYAEAYRYFSLGALLYDDVNCIYKLGDMYLNGYNVEKNERYAFKMYERALGRAVADEQEQDCLADVRFRVGKCLLTGVGTTADVEKAHELLSLALIGFYRRRKTDPFVKGLIKSARQLIDEAERKLVASEK